MRRLIGTVLVLHGVAHAGVAIWATPAGPAWYVTLLWWAAILGFVVAGAGFIGVPTLDEHPLMIAAVAAIASILLIARYPEPLAIAGSAIDGAVLIATIPMTPGIVKRTLGSSPLQKINLFPTAMSVQQRDVEHALRRSVPDDDQSI